MDSGDVAAQRRISVVEQPADAAERRPARSSTGAVTRLSSVVVVPWARWNSDTGDDCVGIAGREAVPAAAVDVEIDEPGTTIDQLAMPAAPAGATALTDDWRCVCRRISTQPSTTPSG